MDQKCSSYSRDMDICTKGVLRCVNTVEEETGNGYMRDLGVVGFEFFNTRFVGLYGTCSYGDTGEDLEALGSVILGSSSRALLQTCRM